MNRLPVSLAVILAAISAYGIGMGLTLPLLSLTLERMGVSGTLNGFNLATAGLASLLVTPFMPGWIARAGAAQFMSYALVVAAAALLGLYLAPNLWAWFPIRFVLSAALNGLFVTTEFWINRLADAGNRGRYVALYSIFLTGSLSVGPLVLQVIGTTGPAPFVAGAAMLVLAMAPVLLARRHAPQSASVPPRRAVFTILKLAPTAFGAAAVFGAIDAGMGALLPVYAVRLGYSEAHAALILSAMGIGALLFQYPLGWLSDHLDRRRVLMVCAGTGVAGACATPFLVAMPWAFYLLLLVWGGLVLGIYSVGLTIIGERFSGPNLSTANAAFVMSYCTGLMAGPAIEGAALQLWDPQGLIVVLGLICATYLVFLLGRLGGAANSTPRR